MRRDTNIEFVLAVAAGPFPNLSEHLLVQGHRKIFIEQSVGAATATTRPCGAIHDIFLFSLVEIGAGRDPCLN